MLLSSHRSSELAHSCSIRRDPDSHAAVALPWHAAAQRHPEAGRMLSLLWGNPHTPHSTRVIFNFTRVILYFTRVKADFYPGNTLEDITSGASFCASAHVERQETVRAEAPRSCRNTHPRAVRWHRTARNDFLRTIRFRSDPARQTAHGC